MISLPPRDVPVTQSEVPLRPGGGLRIGRNALGMWMEAPGGTADFRHPWLATVGGGRARIAVGYIIGEIAVEPVIGQVPIGGDERRPAPSLRLDEGVVNAAGESWICAEVTPDAEGKLGETAVVEIVQRDHPMLTQGKTGRAPLALLVRRGETWQVFQIAHFHLRYVTSLPKSGARNHFFL